MINSVNEYLMEFYSENEEELDKYCIENNPDIFESLSSFNTIPVEIKKKPTALLKKSAFNLGSFQ